MKNLIIFLFLAIGFMTSVNAYDMLDDMRRENEIRANESMDRFHEDCERSNRYIEREDNKRKNQGSPLFGKKNR